MSSNLSIAIRRPSIFAVCGFVVAATALPGFLEAQSKSAPQQRKDATSQPQTIQTLAIVNGQPITRQQVAQVCLQRHGNDVLEGIINRQLVAGACQQQNIAVTLQDVDQEIERRAKKFKLTAERYIEVLRSERHIPPERLKAEIIWMELALRRLAARQIQVDPAEIETALESEYGPRVQVRIIVLDNRQKAEQVASAAQANPAEFENLAKDHSIDPNTAAFRGILPPIRKHSGDPNFENAAFALAEGQVSPIIEIPGNDGKTIQQYVLLKCERHYPATPISDDQRPLVIERIREQLSEQKLGDAAEKLFANLQQTVKIVNVYNDPALRQQYPGVAAMVDDAQISLIQLSEDCIARFGHEILETEINRQLILQALKQKNKTVSNEDLQAEIKRAAESYGLPDVEQWLQYVTKGDKSQVDAYVQDEVWPSVAMKRLVEESVQVDDEDMKKGYEANYGERVQALAIVLADYASAKKVWKMASDNPSKDFFAELAAQYSVEPASKANRGEVPPIQKHGGRQTLEDEAFKLRAGEISGLVNVGEYWIVLYCLGRTTPVAPDFDAVKENLYNDLLEKKLRLAMDELFNDMREAAQIDNFLAGTSQPGRQAMKQATSQPR
jgi:parvulin-like peptidyl-prolyl isomerase